MAVPPFIALPQGVSPASIAVGDISIAALSAGSPESSIRALLVPGFTGSKEDFIAVLPLLASAGVHVYAIDQAGQYESTIDASEDRFSIGSLAGDVVALSHTIWPAGPRPHLVGHSMGGLVSRAAVLRDPDAFASLTLLASGPGAVPEHQHSILRALQAALPQTNLVDIWVAQQVADRADGKAEPSPEVLEFLRVRWLRNSPHGLRAKTSILLTEPDRTAQLAATEVASLVLYGTDDDVWWPHIQADMATRLGAVRHEIPGAAHSPPTETPQETADLLRKFWHERC